MLNVVAFEYEYGVRREFSSPGAGCQLSEFASSCSSEQRSGSSLAASPSSHHLRSSDKIQIATVNAGVCASA